MPSLTPVTTSAQAVLPDPEAGKYIRGNSAGTKYETRTTTETLNDIGAEAALGNPSVDGQVLSSTTGGTRSWITATGDMAKSTYDAANVSEQLLGATATQTVQNKTLDNTNTINAKDTTFTVDDATDATRQIAFDAAGSTGTKTTITSSQTANRTLTLPDATDTLVGRDTTDTLTNKTLTSPVINSPTGITKADVGLGNVDNTSDANKPISTATQTALDAKVAKAGDALTGLLRSNVVATLASAATIDLSTAGTNAGMITALSGTASISTVTMTAGSKVEVICSGTPTLVNGTNLVVEGGANHTCAVGDRVTFVNFDGVKTYAFIKKADGTAVVGAGAAVLASGETSGDGGSGSGSNVSMAQLTGIDLSAASGKVLLVYGRTAIEEASNTANTAILRLRIWEATAGWTTIGTARIEQYLTAGSGNAIREISRTARYVIPSAYAKTGVTLELQGGIDTGTFYYGDQPSYTYFDGEGAGYALGYIVFG